jgi:hypothetical protein
MSDEKQTSGIEPRRNKRLATLVEQDILIKNHEYFEVTDGEVDIFADGTVDETRGTRHEVSREVVAEAISRGSVIFNYDDEVGG